MGGENGRTAADHSCSAISFAVMRDGCAGGLLLFLGGRFVLVIRDNAHAFALESCHQKKGRENLREVG